MGGKDGDYIKILPIHIEDPVVGLITSIVNDKYKFVIAEFNACTGSYEITKDYGKSGEEVNELLEGFIIKE